MQYPMLWIAGALSAGILGAAGLKVSLDGMLAALACALGLLGLSLHRRQGVFLAACLVVTIGGATRVSLNRQSVAADIPNGYYIFKILDFSEPHLDAPSTRRTWTTIEIGNQSLKWQVPPDVALKRGALFRAQLELTQALPPLNSSPLKRLQHQLQPRLWLAKSVGPTSLVRPSDGANAGWDQARQDVAERLAGVFSGDYLGVVWALSLGTRNALPDEIATHWRDFGIGHLLAISGLHVGLLGLSLFWFVRLTLMVVCMGRALSTSRRLAAFTTLVGMWVFCIWVNIPVSAVRACVMASAVLGALLLNRGQNGFNALGLAACAILLEDPSSLLGLGTWLSFGCTWFLLFAATASKNRSTWYRNALMMAVVPWLATLPICALCFGEFYGWGVPANLVAVWVAGWIVTPAAILSALLSLFSFEIPLWVELVFCFGVDSIQTWLEFLGGIHRGYWQVSEQWAWVSLAVVWPMLIGWFQSRMRRAIYCAGLGLGVLLIGNGIQRSMTEPVLEFYVPYVGHGDGLVLSLPNGKTMLIDAGGSRFQSRFDPGEHVLAPLLRKLGATKIDYVVITHPDQDHIGGLEYLFERFSVGQVWLDQAFLEHPRLRKDLERVRALGGEVRTFQDLPNTMFLGQTKIQMIYPRASHGLGEGLSTNQRSLVFRVSNGVHSLLLTGDTDVKMEQLILNHLEPTQLLKVAHHGSVTSSSASFLEKVQPCLAVVSSGRSGLEHFPHPSVLRRFEQRQIPLFQTSQRGGLRFKASPNGWYLESSLESPETVECLAQVTPPNAHPD